MEPSDLESEIAEHAQALAAVKSRLEQLLAGIEAATEEAHNSLGTYQERKLAAGQALAAAGRQFLAAQRQLRKADGLLSDLQQVKLVHIELSHRVNARLTQAGDSPEAQQNLRALMKIRRGLRTTYRRVEHCRQDARLVDKVDPGPDETSTAKGEQEP